jgi:hypothetical protein
MKKLLTMSCCILIAVCSFAQGTHEKTKPKKETIGVAPTPGPEKIYHFSFDMPASEVNRLGFALNLTLDRLDETSAPANQVKDSKTTIKNWGLVLQRQVEAQNDTTKKPPAK